MVYSPNNLDHFQAALLHRVQSTLTGCEARSNTPNNDIVNSDTDLCSNSPSSSTRSFVPDSQDGEDGEEMELEHPRACQHQPVSDQQEDKGRSWPQLCDTCQNVNRIIASLEQYELSVRTYAAFHLDQARRNVPYLFLQAMQATAPEDSDNPNNSDVVGEARQFTKYRQQYSRWCADLDLDEHAVWEKWASSINERQAEATAGGETEIRETQTEAREQEPRMGGQTDSDNQHIDLHMEPMSAVEEVEEPGTAWVRQRIADGHLGRCAIRTTTRTNDT